MVVVHLKCQSCEHEIVNPEIAWLYIPNHALYPFCSRNCRSNWILQHQELLSGVVGEMKKFESTIGKMLTNLHAVLIGDRPATRDAHNPYGCRHLDPNDDLYGVTAEMAGYERADCPKECPHYKQCWA